MRFLGILILAVALGACVKTDDTVEGGTADVSSASFSASSIINTNACIEIELRLLNADGAIITATENINFRVTVSGSANIYEDEQCETINPNHTLEKGAFKVSAYVKDPNTETFNINYEGTSIGSIEVTTFSDNFTTALDGPVRTIEGLNSNRSEFYIGGDFTQVSSVTRNKIARLQANGSLNTDFAPTGTGIPTSGKVYAIQLSDAVNDHIFVGGDFTNFNSVSGARNFIRLLATGSLDQSFIKGDGMPSYVRDLALDSDGYINVAGRIARWSTDGDINGLARFTAPAVVDIFYEGEGFGPTTSYPILSFVIDDQDDIYAGGRFTLYAGSAFERIIKLKSDGSVDASFNVAGTNNGFNNSVEKIALTSDGKLYAGGSFTQYNGNAASRLIRLNANGTVDDSFDIGSGFNGKVYALLANNDGTVFVGGEFTTFNGSSVGRFVKLNEDGSIDTTFEDGTGFNGDVFMIENPGDYSNDIFVGGEFTTYQNQTQNYLVRLDEEGNVD